MMKKFSLMTLLIVILSGSFTCYAQGGLKGINLINEDEVESKAIQDYLENSVNELNSVLLELGIGKSGSVGGYDWENAYKLYRLNGHEIVSLYLEHMNLSDCISENYVWKIPTTNEYMITVGNDTGKGIISGDGKYEVMGISTEEAITVSPNDDRSILKKIFITDDINEIDMLKYVDIPMYRLVLIFFESDNVEYVIPHIKNNYLTGLKTGDIYEVEEFMSIMEEKNYNFEKSDSDNYANGGIGFGENQTQKNVQKQVIVVLVLVSLLGCVIYKRYSKKTE